MVLGTIDTLLVGMVGRAVSMAEIERVRQRQGMKPCGCSCNCVRYFDPRSEGHGRCLPCRKRRCSR